jgi:hypothetical protein
VPGVGFDLLRRRSDLAIEVADQRQQAVEAPADRLAQRELLEKLATTGPEEV